MGDDQKNRTIWCGNLHGDATEELIYELFVQAGPLDDVKIPAGKQFGFITFTHVESVPYAMELLKGVQLYGQTIRMQFRSGSIHETGRSNSQNSGYQQNQRGPPQTPQQNTPGSNGMGGYGGTMGMMAMPSPMGGMGMMGNFNSPLRPPMAGMLMNTGFHRSHSSPEIIHGQLSQMARQGSGNERYTPQNQGNYGRGGRDSPNPNQNQRHGQRGGSRDNGRNNGRGRDDSAQRKGQQRSERDSRPYDRSASHERGYDRYGGGSEDRRKRRHGDDQDRKRDDARENAGRNQQIQKQASQNFRRQMSSPPWKRTVPPWEQDQ